MPSRLTRAMRQLTHFDKEAPALRFRDFILSEGIEATVNPSREGGFNFWVHDEERVDDAQRLLELFERDSDSPEIQSKLREAQNKRKREMAEAAQIQRRVESIERAQKDAQRRTNSAGPVTLFLILGIVGFAAMALLSQGDAGVQQVYAVLQASREQIESGELWRLITPVFVKHGLPRPMAVLSILFTAFWLRTLVTPIEWMKGSLHVLAMFIVSAAVQTIAELYAIGISVGGVLGLITTFYIYIYTRGQLDPTMPVRLRPETHFWFILWVVFTLASPSATLFIPRLIAGGLVGAIWGAAAARRGTRR